MEEMMPYTLNNDYDRPIPRRIAEESGVPRELFGQEKKAASILLFLNPDCFSEQPCQVGKGLRWTPEPG